MHISVKVLSVFSVVMAASVGSALENPLVLIAYRGEGEKCAKGIFFDHSVMRKANADTMVVVRDNRERETYENQLFQYIRGIVARFPNRVHDISRDGINIPSAITVEELQNTADVHQFGLLFLPGWQEACPPRREDLDAFLVRNAFNHGQPILAVCAGCENLMRLGSEFFDSSVANHNPVAVQVNHHIVSHMISISETNGHVINNTPIHAVAVEFRTDDLLLNVVPNGRHDVNSVHKRDISREFINETYWRVWATSVSNSTLPTQSGEPRHDRQGRLMNSQGDVIEAFKCIKYEVPVVGTQWHAEAYVEEDADNISNKLVKFMIDAGIKYRALRELKIRFAAH